mmetsp:Transcript_1984/g.284  ORF Transcript_1984/g.284 Transcript_1984/m.284 type:complete len:91 (-) Transcript_1984:2-274(-)
MYKDFLRFKFGIFVKISSAKLALLILRVESPPECSVFSCVFRSFLLFSRDRPVISILNSFFSSVLRFIYTCKTYLSSEFYYKSLFYSYSN